MVVEKRSTSGELRATADADEGIIEGYAAVWATVDDYKSSFQRGAFIKTIQERGSRVKILWNHGAEVIGTPIELREDDHGLFVRAKLVLTTARAREVYDLVKAGAVDTLSFGFNTIKDKWVNGIRIITEAALKEISPVIFEANSAAVITGVRAMQTANPTPTEERAVMYAKTYAKYELGRRGELIMDSLRRTLDDVWYSNEPAAKRGLVDAALTEFTAMYSAYADDLIANQTPDASFGNDVSLAIRSLLASVEQTPEQYAASTSLTLTEVRALLAGRPEVDHSNVEFLPDDLRAAIGRARSDKIESLCAEIRSGLEPEDVARIRGLLSTLPEPDSTDTAIVAQLSKFRQSLKE